MSFTPFISSTLSGQLNSGTPANDNSCRCLDDADTTVGYESVTHYVTAHVVNLDSDHGQLYFCLIILILSLYRIYMTYNNTIPSRSLTLFKFVFCVFCVCVCATSFLVNIFMYTWQRSLEPCVWRSVAVELTVCDKRYEVGRNGSPILDSRWTGERSSDVINGRSPVQACIHRMYRHRQGVPFVTFSCLRDLHALERFLVRYVATNQRHSWRRITAGDLTVDLVGMFQRHVHLLIGHVRLYSAGSEVRSASHHTVHCEHKVVRFRCIRIAQMNNIVTQENTRFCIKYSNLALASECSAKREINVSEYEKDMDRRPWTAEGIWKWGGGVKLRSRSGDGYRRWSPPPTTGVRGFYLWKMFGNFTCKIGHLGAKSHFVLIICKLQF